jgi:hypothetical protein
MFNIEDQTIIALSDYPELIPHLYIMPPNIREKAKDINSKLVESMLFKADPYISRLWYVTSDNRSGKDKMGWLVNHHSRLPDVHNLRPRDLEELWVQTQLGYIPANSIGDIFEEKVTPNTTIGEIAYNLGLYTESDTESIINKAIKDNPQAVEDYKTGNTKALGTILGVARKEGVTNMKQAAQLLKDKLNAKD